jgi:hypothetical protein
MIHSPGKDPSTVSDSQARGSGPVEGFHLDLDEVWSCCEIQAAASRKEKDFGPSHDNILCDRREHRRSVSASMANRTRRVGGGRGFAGSRKEIGL